MRRIIREVVAMADPISEKELLKIIRQLDMDSMTGETERLTVSIGEEIVNGTVRVENNKLIVTNPQNGGLPATIQCAPPLILKCNGVKVTAETTVSASDKFEWHVEESPLFSIEISADKMEAFFHLKSKHRNAWRLKSLSSDQHLTVEAEEDKETILETLQLTDVMATMRKMQITKNIKPSAIFEELKNPTFKPIIVANGIPPQPSIDARLELYFKEQVEEKFTEVGGSIDFRNRRHIPSVKSGDIIAKKFPPAYGLVGYDIYGQVVKPLPPKDIIVIAREHVELLPSGEFVALKDGRPRLTGQDVKSLGISTTYIVSGNVDMSTGNIVFSGDVIIYGNVQDGMIVESLGNIYVQGSVFRASMAATGSIHVIGNVVASNLYSGYFGVIFNRLYLNTKKLSEHLQAWLEAAKQLLVIIEAKGKNIPIGQSLLILLESKFSDIPIVIREVNHSIANIQNINIMEMGEFKQKIEILQNPMQIAQLDSLGPIQSILNFVKEAFSTIENAQEAHVFIDIAQCHMSNLKSNGNIMIRKEGCLQSELFSKENIVFYQQAAVCRGSRLEAGEMISAMVVGGETGGDIVLKAGKRISIKKIYNGRVFINRYSKNIEQPLEDITIYSDNKGLVIRQEGDKA
jgi:lipopolysaccharide export system protein LptA